MGADEHVLLTVPSNTRLLSLFFVLLPLAGVVSVIAGVNAEGPERLLYLACAVVVFATIEVVWTRWRRRDRIFVATEAGCEVATFRGQHFLPWSAITEIGPVLDGTDFAPYRRRHRDENGWLQKWSRGPSSSFLIHANGRLYSVGSPTSTSGTLEDIRSDVVRFWTERRTL